jgi:hypothetical protein
MVIRVTENVRLRWYTGRVSSPHVLDGWSSLFQPPSTWRSWAGADGYRFMVLICLMRLQVFSFRGAESGLRRQIWHKSCCRRR